MYKTLPVRKFLLNQNEISLTLNACGFSRGAFIFLTPCLVFFNLFFKGLRRVG